MNEQNRYARSFGEQCTPRALVTGALGAVVITASSMYVALRMGALPWPTIFVAVLSFAIMRLFGRHDVNEMNVAATGMSAGAMVTPNARARSCAAAISSGLNAGFGA